MAATNEELFAWEATTPDASDPLGIVTLILPVPPFPVRMPGRYVFQAEHGGVPFAQSPIDILAHEHGEQESQ